MSSCKDTPSATNLAAALSSARVCSCRASSAAVEGLRSELHEKLLRQLLLAENVEDTTREKVCGAQDYPGERCAHTHVLTGVCPRLQATRIVQKGLFLQEAHIVALANFKEKHIMVFQDKEKDKFQCEVFVMHYQPGFRPDRGWHKPARVSRQDVHTLLANGAVPIHLDSPPTHFSALIPVEIPNRTHLRSTRGVTLPNGAIMLPGD
jgi:hypothetical protein